MKKRIPMQDDPTLEYWKTIVSDGVIVKLYVPIQSAEENERAKQEFLDTCSEIFTNMDA